MEELGLAAEAAGVNMYDPAMEQELGAGGTAPQYTVEEIIQLLMQGIDPEELVAQGVPAELVSQAIDIIMSQQQAPEVATPPATDGGLAALGQY